MVLLSPANRNDAPWAVPRMLLAQGWFGCAVQGVRADAADFTTPILNFMVTLWHATPKSGSIPAKRASAFCLPGCGSSSSAAIRANAAPLNVSWRC
jgi:hypothetical protein